MAPPGSGRPGPGARGDPGGRRRLAAELALQRQRLQKGEDVATVRQRLQHALQDPDFASVRGEAAWKQLPDDTAASWRQLWQDVAATVGRAPKAVDKR